MRKEPLLLLALTILVASTVVGCSGGSPCPSTLTILSITEGEVLVMKEGTDDWVPAEQGMELDIGDAVKTGGNSSVKITFFDGSTMELWADTEIEILSLDIACETGITTITLAGQRDYYVWVDAPNYSYNVWNCPENWDIKAAPVGDAEAAYGPLAADALVSVSFVVGE